MKYLWLFLVASPFAAHAESLLCPSETLELLADDTSRGELILTQTLLEEEECISIELTYKGRAWLGFGFNKNGQMVGSTVVVGLPDEDDAEVELEVEDEDLLQSNSSTVYNATTTLGATSSVVEAKRFFLGSKSMNGIQSFEPDKPVYYIPPSPPPDDDNEDDKGDGWRRQLEFPGKHNEHRLLAVSNATLFQNATHTRLRVVRPLLENSKEGLQVTVDPDNLNTFIYAVGRSNTLGYHAIRGSRTLEFSSDCPHGTFAPSTGDVPTNIVKSGLP